MMVVISFTNLKGGSSKSTTAFNLAGALVEAGYRVMVIDLDPQCTISWRFLGIEPPTGDETLSRSLLDDGLLDGLVRSTPYGGLWVVPADDGLKVIKSGQAQIEGGELRLRSCLERYRVSGRPQVDLVLCDNPPSLDRLTMNSLTASDYVLLPVDPGAGGRGALNDTLDYINAARKWYNPSLKILGLLVNNIKPHTIYDQATEQVVREIYGPLVFDTVIPTSVRVREAAEQQTPLVFLPVRVYGRYADYYRQLRDEVIERLGWGERHDTA